MTQLPLLSHEPEPTVAMKEPSTHFATSVPFDPVRLTLAQLINVVFDLNPDSHFGQTILERYPVSRRFLTDSLQDICEAIGIEEQIAKKLKVTFELGRRLIALAEKRPQITSPTDAATMFIAEMSHLEQEEMWLMLLDTRNRVIDMKAVYRGNINTIIIRPAEIFKCAIRGNANSIIIAHNHPSGDSTPSPEDIKVTKEIMKAGKLLGIELLDHLVIGEGSHHSIKESHLVAFK